MYINLEWKSYVPGLNFDMCLNSPRIKTHLPFRNDSTSSEVVKIKIDLPWNLKMSLILGFHEIPSTHLANILFMNTFFPTL